MRMNRWFFTLQMVVLVWIVTMGPRSPRAEFWAWVAPVFAGFIGFSFDARLRGLEEKLEGRKD